MTLVSELRVLSVEQYIRRLSGQDKETQNIDHNYVKAWNAHPDSHRTKPARLLFMKGLQRYPEVISSSNLEVDVESYEESLASPFDNPKSKFLPEETEKILIGTPLFREPSDEGIEVDMDSMDSEQQKLYNKVLNYLQEDHLAKLSYNGATNESLKKRIVTDKTAGLIRRTFSSIFWDIELLSWLHKTLLTTSENSLLATYIDVLQTLKSKVPELTDRILQSCAGTPEGDAVMHILRKPWDPVLPLLSQTKPRRLANNPIILICPSSPRQQTVGSHAQRLQLWQTHLSNMSKVVSVAACPEDSKISPTIEGCLEQIMTAVRSKVKEVKNHYPNRPLVLLGWTIGALIACHIALQEQVDAVICLGFPLKGVNGSRGDLNDPLLDCKVPTLFVIGQNSQTCSTDDIEDFRARMAADTGLVVVGGADDMLRMCPSKMSMCSVTQPMVDRCLLDEIYDFLTSAFVKMPSTSAVSPTVPTAKVCTPILEEEPEPLMEEWKPEEDGKRRRRKPREYSPELSPVRKRVKHHMSRQVSNHHPKSRLSPSSSDSSSSGSINVKRPLKSIPKPERRVGRPPGPTWRKRLNIKPIRDPRKEAKLMRKAAILAEQEAYSPSKPEPKPVPFSKNILPKRNEPVDVEKAFGCDSSFLPRSLSSLSPPEPEDTVSAEETEKIMAELDALEKAAASKEAQATTSLTNTITLLGESVPERIFQPISDSIKPVEEPKSVQLTVPKPLSSTTEKKVVVPLTTSMEGVLSKKLSLVSPFQTLKGNTTVSLVTPTSGSSAPLTKSTVITVPPAAAATLLTASPVLKGQPNKVIQFLSKAGSFSASKPAGAFKSVPGTSTDGSDSRSCNLSLLSDVAGMSEHVLDKPTSPAATLVKLGTPERNTQFQPMKCMKIIKAPAPLVRADTTEEMVEKHLAIQALNKSIGVESSGVPAPREPGYSVCYAKPDGSIVSRSIVRPCLPSFSTRSPMPPRGRGRGRPPMTPRPFRLYDN